MQEMWVRSLGQENPLEKGMATHFSILAWRILDRGAWWITVHEVAKSWTSRILQTTQVLWTLSKVRPWFTGASTLLPVAVLAAVTAAKVT